VGLATPTGAGVASRSGSAQWAFADSGGYQPPQPNRGHAGVPDGMRDLHDGFAALQIEISEIQQVGDRVVGNGRIRTRGKRSGVESWSPFGAVMEFKNGKAAQFAPISILEKPSKQPGCGSSPR
jgi:SnoaL-like domain